MTPADRDRLLTAIRALPVAARTAEPTPLHLVWREDVEELIEGAATARRGCAHQPPAGAP